MRTPERFRAELKDSLLAQADELVSQAVRELPHRRQRRALTRLASSAAVALIAAVAAVVTLASQGTTPPPASAATALYTAAAALQRSGPNLELGPHRYLYERTIERSRFLDPSAKTLLHALDEAWTARTGAGRIDDTVLNPAAIRHLHDTNNGPSHLHASAHPFTLINGISFSYGQLQRLPSSPERLATVVGRLANRTARARDESSRSAHGMTVLEILRSIALSPTPTAVRAAVYQVMASTPGIRLLGHRRDALGRRGDMFSAILGPERAEMIINATTGRLLQFTRILMHRSGLEPRWRPGLISRDTYVDLAVVGSITARPH